MYWLAKERGLHFHNYDELWDWSVTELEAFWQAVWDRYGGISNTPHRAVLESRKMPGTRWFPGAHVNYAEHVLRHERPHATAVLHLSERQKITALTWEELGGKVRVLATQLRKLGVQPGDRVVACLPNIPEAMIAMLATTSIGAIWSSCGPILARAACWTALRSSPRRFCFVWMATSTVASRSTVARRWKRSSPRCQRSSA